MVFYRNNVLRIWPILILCISLHAEVEQSLLFDNQTDSLVKVELRPSCVPFDQHQSRIEVVGGDKQRIDFIVPDTEESHCLVVHHEDSGDILISRSDFKNPKCKITLVAGKEELLLKQNRC